LLQNLLYAGTQYRSHLVHQLWCMHYKYDKIFRHFFFISLKYKTTYSADGFLCCTGYIYSRYRGIFELLASSRFSGSVPNLSTMATSISDFKFTMKEIGIFKQKHIHLCTKLGYTYFFFRKYILETKVFVSIMTWPNFDLDPYHLVWLLLTPWYSYMLTMMFLKRKTKKLKKISFLPYDVIKSKFLLIWKALIKTFHMR
jgi:hypothetical protein